MTSAGQEVSSERRIVRPATLMTCGAKEWETVVARILSL